MSADIPSGACWSPNEGDGQVRSDPLVPKEVEKEVAVGGGGGRRRRRWQWGSIVSGVTTCCTCHSAAQQAEEQTAEAAGHLSIT